MRITDDIEVTLVLILFINETNIHIYILTHPVVSSRGPSTLVIGTSLVRGLGIKLTNLGANATVCSYQGQDIPYIRSRIPYVVSRRNPPEQVVLQCSGNDCEHTEASYVTSQYECLISEIQQILPQCPYHSQYHSAAGK